MFEEERKDAGAAGEEVGSGGISGASQEMKGEEDAEDRVAVVDRMWVDGVDAEDGERRGEKESEGPPTSRSKCGDSGCARMTSFVPGVRKREVGNQQTKQDAPGEDGGSARFECGTQDVREVDAAEDADDRGVKKEG